MPIVTCKYTGIAFKAASEQEITPPRVAILLDEAMRNGTANVVVDFIEEARAAGISDLDAIIAHVRNGLQGYRLIKAEADERRRQRFRVVAPSWMEDDG